MISRAVFYLQPMLFFMFLTSCLSTSEQHGSHGDKPDTVLHRFLKNSFHNRGGIQVGLVLNGETVFLDAFGNADFSAGSGEMTNEHFMHTASITKQFTGWAVAQLIHEGKISLVDPVEKFLDAPSALKGITIAELLGHTHGLQSPDELIDVRGINKKHYNNKDALEIIFSQKKRIESKRGEYGNAGYNLLAEIISKVSGLTYNGYIKQNVLTPAGMLASEIVDDCSAIPKGIVPSIYVDEDFSFHPQRYFTCFEGSIGLKSNAENLTRWMKFLIAEGRKKSPVFEIFSKPVSTVRDGGLDRPYAMGTFVDEVPHGAAPDDKNTEAIKNNARVFSHGGTLVGFQHSLSFSPELNLGVVVLSNTSSTDSELIATNLRAYLISQNESALFEKTQVCEPEKSKRLAGIYPFETFSRNFALVTDGRCLWTKSPSGLVSVTETKNKPGVYSVGHGIEFFEVADNDTRQKTRRLKLNGKFNLFRPKLINGRNFPVEPFLGVYKRKKERPLEILLKDGSLYLKVKQNLFTLYWSGDQYLRTLNPVYGAIRFVFSPEGEVIGMKHSMNSVESSLFEKEVRTKTADILEIPDTHLPEKRVEPDADERKLDKIFQAFLESTDVQGQAVSKYVSDILGQVELFKKIEEPHLRIPLVYWSRGYISAVNNYELTPENRKGIGELDALILREFNSIEGDITQSSLGMCLYLLNTHPIDGLADYNKGTAAVQKVWHRFSPEEQLVVATGMSLWSPLSAARIAKYAMKFGSKKKAKWILEALFKE